MLADVIGLKAVSHWAGGSRAGLLLLSPYIRVVHRHQAPNSWKGKMQKMRVRAVMLIMHLGTEER